jgi:hypothetical protein
MLYELPRHHPTERNAEHHQNGLRYDRGDEELTPGDRGDAGRDHCAGDEPARQVCPKKQQTAGRADDERFDCAQELCAA